MSASTQSNVQVMSMDGVAPPQQTASMPSEPDLMGGARPKRHASGGSCKSSSGRGNMKGITRPAIRRLARRAGVKRIGAGKRAEGDVYDDVYDYTKDVLYEFLKTVLRDAIIYAEHAKRKTITAADIVSALKRDGKTLYGFT